MGGVRDDDRPLNWVLRMVNMVAVILAMSERSCRIGRDAIIGIALTIAVVASSFTASSAATVTVAPGETLLGIADEYGTTVAALEAANSLTDPNTIVAGSVLQIPGPGAATEGSPTADRTVVVARGDTLLGIADQYGTTVDAIEAANHLSDPNRIVIGSVLQVPGTGSSAQTLNNAPASSGGNVVVAAGETLTEIAHQYGTTVDGLATLNDLADPNQVAIGSVLKIPEAGASATATLASGTSGVTVTISPGQTLSSIAAVHGTTVAMLEAVNGIVHPDLIVSGMQLHLPPANTSALASDIVGRQSASHLALGLPEPGYPAICVRPLGGRGGCQSSPVGSDVLVGVGLADLYLVGDWRSGRLPTRVLDSRRSAGTARTTHPRPERCVGQHRNGGGVLTPAPDRHRWRCVHGTGRLLPGAGFRPEHRPLPVNRAVREGDLGLRAIVRLRTSRGL